MINRFCRTRQPTLECTTLALGFVLACGSDAAHAGPILNDVKEQNGFIQAELAEGAFTPEHLLDLEGKTLTITPDGAGGFDLQAGPLEWDPDFGQRVDAAGEGFPSTSVTLDGFTFPFAGTTWNQVFVNAFGNVSFGGGQQEFFSIPISTAATVRFARLATRSFSEVCRSSRRCFTSSMVKATISSCARKPTPCW